MSSFELECTNCPRLAAHLATVRRDYPQYHARPVPPFGVEQPRLLIVGLGPGMHGANASGRPFTGDHAGIMLYQTLHQFGFSTRPESKDKNDGLELIDCRITNAVKCLPPANKPTGEEIKTCNEYLKNEIAAIKGELLILALGRIAHEAVLRCLQLKRKDYDFAHNASHKLGDNRWLVSSYHCSRYNTQTRRLTEQMFHDVFRNIQQILKITG